ncbi:hypothetical protein NHH82_20890 [Oxalobacteraceae bacterium OTU3REALA1]|nr:hypothetical protein NHH82_20890 [Oxalobacteraceae bacterium OTU3REALA1]
MDKIERAIAQAFTPELVAHGFELKRDWGSFVRRQPYGFDALVVVNQGSASTEYFEIACYGHIHHDRIEIPWNTSGFIYGEDNQQQTWTVLLSRPKNQPHWKIFPASLAADAANVALEIAAYFSQYALPFYQRFADVSEVEMLANTIPMVDSAKLSPYSVGGPLDHQAMRSLLLAKAVNPERYAQVREAFITSPKKTLFPRDKCMKMVERIDAMEAV